jgi:hypothetical protein
LLAGTIDPHGEHPVQQFVILGAGFDTRAWGLLAGADGPIFEVDMPPPPGEASRRPASTSSGSVTSHGLELADYEPYGPEDEAFGGLALAIRHG